MATVKTTLNRRSEVAQFTPEALASEEAASQIEVQGARYPESAQQMVDR